MNLAYDLVRLNLNPLYNDSDIVTRICRASGMEGGTLWLHVIPE